MTSIEFAAIEFFEWPAAESYAVVTSSRGDTLVDEADNFPLLVANGKVASKKPIAMGAAALWAYLLTELEPSETTELLWPSFFTQARKVASQFGMLTRKSEDGETESLSAWRDFYLRLRSLADFSQTGSPADFQGPVARAVIDLVPAGPGMGGPTLWGRPATLRDAILTAAVEVIVSGGVMRECVWDQKLFVAGGLGERGVRATFCSDNCRVAFNNDKAKQRKLAREQAPRRA